MEFISVLCPVVIMSMSLLNAPDFLLQLGLVKITKDPSPLHSSEERAKS